MSLLKNIHVVLVRAENPANIGQAARAMKNFAVSKLLLVNCTPIQDSEAYTTGWKAKKILDSAKIFQDLSKTLKKPNLSIGFTRRFRSERGTPVNLAKLVPKILEAMQDKKIYLLFGNEKNGLSNEELSFCDIIATIPANPTYQSLNLSHAVVITLFEIYSQINDTPLMFEKHQRFYATSKEFEELMKDVLKTLRILGYEKIKKKDLIHKVHQQIRNFFQKSTLEQRELYLFKAFLHKIQDQLSCLPLPASKRKNESILLENN